MSDKIFVNLHQHSLVSIGDALSSPNDIAQRCKELGMDTIAITDHGTLAGWLQFRDACKKYNIKPIFGCEVYFVDDVQTVYGINTNIKALQAEIAPLAKEKTKASKKLLEKETEKLLALQEQRKVAKKYNHLILLAKTLEGSVNIMKIHNEAVIDGIYFKPRCDWAVLERHRGGIIATSSCLGGRLAKLLANDDVEGAKANLARFQSIFGKENFYLELQLHDIKLQTEVNSKLIKLAEATGAPLVATLDAHYTNEDDFRTRTLIRQLDKNPDEINNDDELTDLFIKNEDMLLKSWLKYMPGHSPQILANAILNTRKIADSISEFEFDTSLKFPTFETNGLTQEKFLTTMAWDGLKNRKLDANPVYVARLKKELNTVTVLGFASYFNIVSNYINEAKKSQPTGPGRGSVAGSLLAYCLGITEVDPIKFKLYFERFLNIDKAIIPPTFGLPKLSQTQIDYKHILGDCACHQKH